MIWLGIGLCTLVSMLFSGLESAVLSVSLVRVRHRAKEHENAARELLKLFEHRERLLSSILLVNTLINLLTFSALTTQMVGWVGDWGYAIAFAIALPVYVFLIELLPKSLFKLFPYRMLATFVPVLKGVRLTASPVIWLGAEIASTFRSKEEVPVVRRERDMDAERLDFRAIAAVSEKQGELGETEAAMIRSVLDFHQRHVADVMIRMANVTAVPANMPIPKAIQIARRSNLYHLPVMDDNGQLIGLLNIYEALREGRVRGPVYSLIRRLVRVSTTDTGTAAIRTLRASGLKVAAVYDRSKKLVGIVTLHDLVNELVKLTVSAK
ncbi:MAG: putative hemolysin [Verrucomicrobiales bacterium]|jgi:putative hemolysin